MSTFRDAPRTGGRAADDRSAWHVAAALLALGIGAFVAYVAILCDRLPFVHPESARYLANVFRDASWPALVFDVQRDDFGNYQGRELSYVFDLVDARVVASLFAATGRLLPFSLTHMLVVSALPLFVIADAGSTPMSRGSRTVTVGAALAAAFAASRSSGDADLSLAAFTAARARCFF